MASDFRIYMHRNSDNLHLELLGDFDDALAHQLINILKSYSPGTSYVFINTGNLKHVHSFGRDMFQNNLYQLNHKFFGNIIYTGEHAPEIAPETSRVW